MVLTDIFHERVTTENMKTGSKSTTFTIELGKVRQNSQMQDQKFENLTFAEFGQLLIPGTEAEEWQ